MEAVQKEAIGPTPTTTDGEYVGGEAQGLFWAPASSGCGAPPTVGKRVGEVLDVNRITSDVDKSNKVEEEVGEAQLERVSGPGGRVDTQPNFARGAQAFP